MSLDEAFPWPEDYQCMHVKLFPHGVFHAENVGGQIDEVLRQEGLARLLPLPLQGRRGGVRADRGLRGGE